MLCSFMRSMHLMLRYTDMPGVEASAVLEAHYEDSSEDDDEQ